MRNEAPAAKSAVTPSGLPEAPFGANEVRLSARQWLLALAIVALVMLATPRLWERIERFDTGPDYRLPYSLSKDYWLYGRRLRNVAGSNQVVMIGDSVTWGEYVLPDGTLSHFLNQEAGDPRRFVNAGVNGLFPLALEGLIRHYGPSLRQQKVMLQCNVLWMSSPKADLSTEKEEPFNHARLVPQFCARIPCYRADANERLSALVEREVGFVSWVSHLQNAYYGQKSILAWTLEEDSASPPRYPNLWKNPFGPIGLTVPSAAPDDPERGPRSPRHASWSASGHGPTHFDWVGLDASLQWRAFQQMTGLLRERGNDVLVILGPFNEHMVAPESRAEYRKICDGIAAWLAQNQIPHIVPETLPTALYADASHPLTEGYQVLAKQLYGNEGFQKWLKGP